jgi:hypothetical protein
MGGDTFIASLRERLIEFVDRRKITILDGDTLVNYDNSYQRA